jgi:hypothetical protein
MFSICPFVLHDFSKPFKRRRSVVFVGYISNSKQLSKRQSTKKIHSFSHRPDFKPRAVYQS